MSASQLSFSSFFCKESFCCCFLFRSFALAARCHSRSTPKVFSSFGKKWRNRRIAIAVVKSFSGAMGSQINARYPPATALIHPIPFQTPIPRRAYAQPFVISHAIPKHSKNRGFSSKAISRRSHAPKRLHHTTLFCIFIAPCPPQASARVRCFAAEYSWHSRPARYAHPSAFRRLF